MDENIKINLARVSQSINIHGKNYPATLILVPWCYAVVLCVTKLHHPRTIYLVGALLEYYGRMAAGSKPYK